MIERGQKIKEEEFTNILQEREKYINKTGNIKIINFTKEEFLNNNKLLVIQ